MRARTAAGFVLAIAVFAGLVAGATAERKQGTHMHNARYCEIFELKGAPPDAKVIVWNTIGLNDCPAEWWDNLDTDRIAEQNGDTLVLKNGPRNFLMDSARAKTGAVKFFQGERARRVATIPIPTVADLATTPYTDRTINRVNTWHWKKGRKVFLLQAPDGYDYMMQSYSQIVDTEQKITDLPSLGDRLELPQGWSYKVKKLKKPLTLNAKGSATILQDDLKNTYQKLPPSAKKRKKHEVAMTGETKSIKFDLPTVEDAGTVTGTPFGDGTIDALVTFGANSTITGTYTIDAKKGEIFGTMNAAYIVADGEIDFNGTATMTGGTGRYRGIVGKNLVFHDHNTFPDGQNGTIEISGSARY